MFPAWDVYRTYLAQQLTTAGHDVDDLDHQHDVDDLDHELSDVSPL